MAVKVQFEIGHTAKLKREKTSEGFTHDWELYVKGIDKADISHFVEKVVFNLHDSFPKPKRVYKESPYVLKESGYAGFILPIDIYFRNRDEPKKVTYSYDLDLQTIGPPVHRSEIKKFTFNNPSEDFRQKLLKGGGISLVNNTDEKSRDSIDERSQLISKPKLSSDNINTKKYNKIRSDESKNQTFASLFGPPITKTTNKVSPDPKNKASPNLSSANKLNKQPLDKIASLSSSSSNLNKDKSEKTDKKDKHKHNSPHKEKGVGGGGGGGNNSSDIIKEIKKNAIEEKLRREDKKKDKTHSKERDRSKEKSSKQRPPSPKRLPSPKRSSPARLSLVTSNRGEENGFKQSSKSNILEVADGKKATNNNSSNKKSKKDKKSHDKEKDRERKERDREKKDKDERMSVNSRDSVTSQNSSMIGTNVTRISAENKIDPPISRREKESGAGIGIAGKDNKRIDSKNADNMGNFEKRISDKHDKDNKDKDTEKKHKHKKKDKNKEKEREKDKDYQPSKERKKEKSSKIKETESKKQQQQQQLLQQTTQNTSGNDSGIVTSKSSTNPLIALMHELSDRDSSESENESVVPSVSEKINNNSDSSNSSFPDIPQSKQSSTVSQAIPAINEIKDTKKERKTREKISKTEKDEKKRKRKSKDDSENQLNRKSASPAIGSHGEPPSKQIKKDDYYMKNGEKSNSPIMPAPQIIPAGNNNSTGSNQLTTRAVTTSSSSLSPRTGDNTPFRTPSSNNVIGSGIGGSGGGGAGGGSNLPPLSSSSSSLTTGGTAQNERHNLTVDYMTELRELQQKIMTLQDNNDLQQVVEMIAATGRFEVTNKTFDFDLCALDRMTVQRLQDFFATSVS